jgi:hypothetical protein
MLPKGRRASYCAGYSLFRYLQASSKPVAQAKSSLAPDRRSLLPPMMFSCTAHQTLVSSEGSTCAPSQRLSLTARRRRSLPGPPR